MNKIIEKPWGSEEIVYFENSITVKILRVYQPLSIQIHPLKDEVFTLLDFDKNILPDPYIAIKKPVSFEDCMNVDEGMVNIYMDIGSQLDCPRGTVHYIPGGLTLLEYSKGQNITLRVKDFYGRGEDTELIKEMFGN